MIRLEVFSPSLEALCMPIMLYIFALQHSDTHDSFLMEMVQCSLKTTFFLSVLYLVSFF